jgi:hypothetical protein
MDLQSIVVDPLLPPEPGQPGARELVVSSTMLVIPESVASPLSPLDKESVMMALYP